MEQHSSSPLFSLSVDPTTRAHLAETARWARFLAIVGMVFLVLIVLFGLFFSSLFGNNPFQSPMAESEPSTEVSTFMGIVMAVVYIILTIIWFFPLLYLMRFASTMKTALQGNDQGALNTSFQNLKACFRYVGLFTIILLAIYALLFLIAIVGVGGVI